MSFDDTPDLPNDYVRLARSLKELWDNNDPNVHEYIARWYRSAYGESRIYARSEEEARSFGNRSLDFDFEDYGGDGDWDLGDIELADDERDI